MSQKEEERFYILLRFKDKEIDLKRAASMMGVSYRHAKRIWKAFKENGKDGLKSKKKGIRSNRAVPEDVKNQVIAIISSKYPDFGPTLAKEKLEKEGFVFCKETVRRIMIESDLWSPKKQKKVRVYQQRERRECFGDLLQSDGSHHDWFEDRGPKCCLLATIGDATGKVHAHFEEKETTNGYFQLFRDYFLLYGRPIQLYVDKFGVFRVNNETDRFQLTQFTRAMKELDIEVICAHSPQAKGRIERLFGILQDRLVKELRLRGISTIEEANAFLPEYLEEHNRKFGKAPAKPFNTHKPLNQKIDLERILCKKETRKVTKNLEVRYDNKILQIQEPSRKNRLKGAKVEVLETLSGEILLEYQKENLEYKIFEAAVSFQPPVKDHKQLEAEWERQSRQRRHKPHKHHPWRQQPRGPTFLPKW